MNWYLTKLVFRIICGEGHHTPQFDEQLRLVSATDECEAFEKAMAIGRATNIRYDRHTPPNARRDRCLAVPPTSAAFTRK